MDSFHHTRSLYLSNLFSNVPMHWYNLLFWRSNFIWFHPIHSSSGWPFIANLMFPLHLEWIDWYWCHFSWLGDLIYFVWYDPCKITLGIIHCSTYFMTIMDVYRCFTALLSFPALTDGHLIAYLRDFGHLRVRTSVMINSIGTPFYMWLLYANRDSLSGLSYDPWYQKHGLLTHTVDREQIVHS